MLALFRLLSRGTFRRQALHMTLAVLGIGAGVATFAALRAAQTALVEGLTTTAEASAGNADLQITGVGGVPETLLDQVVPLPSVRAVAPVIEEVVALEPAAAGSVLLLGVDLVGDRHVRAYRFEGDDADVDDPLVFLAQPDSVAISRTLADRLQLDKGGVLTIRVHAVTRRLVVRAIIGQSALSRAFGGAIVITDVYAAQLLLGRGRRFDRLDVTADADARPAVAAAVGPGYQVDTPEGRLQSQRALVRHFDASFTASRVLGVVIAAFLVFNVCTVAVERRRRQIGILRTLGATSAQIRVLFLGEALVLGSAGGAVGLWIGWLLAFEATEVMRAAVGQLYGLVTVATPVVSAQLAAESIGLGAIAAIGGAWFPVRAACRVRPVETWSVSHPVWQRARIRPWSVIVVLACAVVATLSFRYPAKDETVFLFATLAPVGIGLAICSGPLAAAVLLLAARTLGRFGPASARIAIDALRSQATRTATATAAMLLALVFALGIGGHLRALEATFSGGIERMFHADLYVRASSGFAPASARLPWALADELSRMPGVRSARGLRYDLVPYRGGEVMLAAADVALLQVWSSRDRVDSRPGNADVDFARPDVCVISDNLARRLGLGAGDSLVLGTPAGPVSFAIAAVVDVLLSEYGVVAVPRSVFEGYWGDERVDQVWVTFEPSADRSALTTAIAARLADGHPALLSTRDELVGSARQAIDRFVVFTRVTALMAAGVAFVNVLASLIISVALRRREISLLKTLGGTRSQVVGAVVGEAVILAMVALCVAAPMGAALAWFFSRALVELYFGFYVRPQYAYDLLLMLVVALPVVASLAAWLPARHAVAIRPLEVLSHE